LLETNPPRASAADRLMSSSSGRSGKAEAEGDLEDPPETSQQGARRRSGGASGLIAVLLKAGSPMLNPSIRWACVTHFLTGPLGGRVRCPLVCHFRVSLLQGTRANPGFAGC